MASASSSAILVPPPSPKIDQLQGVWLQRRGDKTCHKAALRLTSHHLIFDLQPSSSASDRTAPRTHAVPLSLILKATRIPSLRISAQASQPSQRIYPITLFLKNFDSAALAVHSENDQAAVFDSLKECAILTDISQLYAFYYQPASLDPAAARSHTSRIYDPKQEFARQGLGSRSKAWRFTDINAQYAFCATYPALMAVPSRISDTTLSYAAKYRSKARIPALSYLHWANHASITRSSQPMVGLKNARSIQDEKLIEAIFTSHHFADPESITAKAAAEASGGAASSASGPPAIATVYGATTTNLIIDARPTTNAMANVAKGAGTENMEYYKGCKKSYLGIENIHVMRDSLNKLTDALRESEPIATFGMRVEALGDASAADAVTDGSGSVLRLHPSPVDPLALRKSMWLKHIQSLMEGSMSIVRNVHINSSHVLIHCSDGWDRTSQLAAIAQICLDPYFRTFDGLAVLIEKDWLSFGHKFTDRGGLKGSDRYFTVASKHSYASTNDADGDQEDTDSDLDKPSNPSGGGGFDSQAAANAFWGFTKQLTANFSAATSGATAGPKKGSNIKETSPVFHQFLDCMWQIMRQFPDRFEYASSYLVELLQAVQECKYGTFLMDCERERLAPCNEEGRVLPTLPSRTVSAWTYLLSSDVKQKHRNPRYQPELDDRDPKRKATDMGVLIADSRDVRYFEQLFRRATGDMNAALEKEADERRRARERLERAVRGNGAETPPPSDATRAEVMVEGGGPVAPSVPVPGAGELERSDAAIAVVGAGDPDPVLDPLASAAARIDVNTSSSGSARTANTATSPAAGAVDLASNTHIDPGQLSYQARQPRVRAQGAATSSSPAVPHHAGPLDPSISGQTNMPSAADAAANRMKNLLIGGWGRLQEAMASPAAAPSGVSPSSETAHPPYHTGSQAEGGYLPDSSARAATERRAGSQSSAWPIDADQSHQARTHTGAGAPAHTVHNPWAAATSVRAEMQREHVAMLSSYGVQDVGGTRHGPSAGGVQSGRHDQVPNGNDGRGDQVGSEVKPEGNANARITSDPLGVL